MKYSGEPPHDPWLDPPYPNGGGDSWLDGPVSGKGSDDAGEWAGSQYGETDNAAAGYGESQPVGRLHDDWADAQYGAVQPADLGMAVEASKKSESERRGWRKVAIATGALAAAAGVVIASMVVARGHGSAEPPQLVPGPVASSSAHPHTARSPVIENGVISLANAAQAAAVVPASVKADKSSVTAVINYSNRQQAGMGWTMETGFGTGYVAQDANGENRMYSAAHVVVGNAQEGYSAFPNFAVATDIDGEERIDHIDGLHVSNAYDSKSGLANDASIDLAIANVATRGWAGADGQTHAGQNDFGSIRGIPFAKTPPKVGDVVYQLTERTGNTDASATWLRPPRWAQIKKEIVIALSGNRVFLLPLDQTLTENQWKGGSGGPVVEGGDGADSGAVFGTYIEGGMYPEAQFASVFGFKIAGYGPNKQVHFNVATIDSASTLAAVGNAALHHVPMPRYYPA